ncbi:MAG: tRNA pseudouridine(55) synthase TruB [Dehalobacterium sp.]
MDGFINFLKPPGMTSHDAVGFVRKKLKIKKVGHTGTLDPGVAGVLPICVGRATRLAEYITVRPKSYRAEITLGIATDSQDAYGSIMSKNDCSGIPYEKFEEIISDFIGDIKQIPPMTSAVRVGGERLYNLARKGIEIERAPKNVTIHRIDIIKKDWEMPNPKVIFDVLCSKGTYIRTLCHDIGARLGVGAYLSFLIRTQTGSFNIHHAWTIEEICSSIERDNGDFLLPIHEGICFIPAITIDDEQSKNLLHGKTIIMPEKGYCDNQIYQIKNTNNVFLAVGQVITEDEGISLFKPDKVFG